MSEPRPDRPVNLGFVGAGFIGQLGHIENYAQLEGCRLVALSEMRPELRQKVAQRHGFLRTYAHHKEMLQDPEVEAVVVVTPRPYTGPIALDCLEAGKHVLTEKPMAHTVEQAERLVEAARKRGLVYSVGYMKRHDEGVQRAKEMLDKLLASGELGPIVFARAHCFMGESYCRADGHVVTGETAQYSDPGWAVAPDWLPRERRRDFAWFLNVYAHNLNLLRYLIGRTPRARYADLRSQEGQAAVLDFGDFPAVLETGRFSYYTWDEVTEIYLAHGRLRIETPPALLKNTPARLELYQGKESRCLISPKCDWTWAFRRQAAAFVRDVREGAEPLASGADSLEDLRLAEELWRLEAARG